MHNRALKFVKWPLTKLTLQCTGILFQISYVRVNEGNILPHMERADTHLP